MWELYVFAFTHRVIIDININDLDHVWRKIDGIHGDENTYLRQKCAY